MRVLVACEFSGRVRDAFLARGHDAISCDRIATTAPGPHIRGDVRNWLDQGWDLMIAFPPCTHVCLSGISWHKGSAEMHKAVSFVRELWSAPIPRIAIENPVGVLSTQFRKPDQYFQPWMFGHGEVKRTCLWLKDLPVLEATNVVDGREPRILRMGRGDSAKRSLTYPGVAVAMAKQWG